MKPYPRAFWFAAFVVVAARVCSGAVAPPRVNVVVLPSEGGISRAQITTEHYSCYYERYDPQEIGPLLEQACSAWCEFFEVKLPLKQQFIVRMYGTADRYVAGGKKFGHWAPVFGPNMGNYWPTSRIASAYATSDGGAMR